MAGRVGRHARPCPGQPPRAGRGVARRHRVRPPMGSVAAQQGMFSILPLTEAQVTKLREDHGIYMLWDGRVNMAGMDPSRAGDVARAVAGVMRG